MREGLKEISIKYSKKWVYSLLGRRGIFLHSLDINIDESLKAQVYQYAGFEFLDSSLLNKELNYENIFKAIDPGSEFRQVCNDLELDIDIAVDHIKKYVLYLVIEEVRTLICANKGALRKIKDEDIKNQKIQDLFNEVFFKTPRDLFNTLSYIDGYFTPEQIESKLDNEYGNPSEKISTAESQKKWERSSKKTGSFYSLYVRYATRKSRKSRSLVKPFNKITDFNQEILNKKEHFHRFNDSIKVADVDPSLDLWSFDYNTYLFMLQKISGYKELQNLKGEYFPILASLSIVGDIRLKLCLVETLFNTSSWRYWETKISNIFLLSIVIIPFFKEYIKDKLMELVNKSMLETNYVISDFNKSEVKLHNLRKQMCVYQILKTEHCYEAESLASEFNIDFKSNVEVTDGLINAWKHIENVKSTIDKDFKDLFAIFLDSLLFQHSAADVMKQEELTIDFKDAIAIGVHQATDEYRSLIIKHSNKNNTNISQSILEMHSGKFDEEKIKCYRSLNIRE
ncbi:hypothetical protein [Priestia aryabhattai]|uniref:hypothetical protein n=1 Tax=Priestia aryabhattai TaxID=412384 RepID=UPI0030EDB7C8